VPNEDNEVSSTLQRCFKKIGMKVMTSASVESVSLEGEKCKVVVNGKKGEETIETDIVLSAVGVETNISDLGLEALGVAIERSKIVVDDFYKTNIDGIYAIGDIVHGPALAHVASKEAHICIESIKGLNPKALKYDNIPACTYTNPEIASCGMSEQKAIAEGKQIKIGKFMFMASGKAAAAGNRDGFVKIVIDAITDEVLGCHIIGDNATEMIYQIIIARENKITAKQIAEAIAPHPTMSEAIMEAIEAAYGENIHG
jgi:dihydrolipoamide dehydrogenase